MSSRPQTAEDKGTNVKVVVRCRPFSLSEKVREKVSSLRIDRQAVHLSAKGSKMGVAKSYNFDGAYDEETTQADFFAEVGKPIVEEVLKGFNCTIFAYGQTGTGKTFTMEGLKDESTGAGCAPGTKGAGIIPRAVEQIFSELQALGIEYSVRVCAMELYNEELSDLIATGDDNKEIKLVTDPKKGLVIQGVEEKAVSTPADIYSIVELAQRRRTTAETLMNKHSSRSHSIFTINIMMRETSAEGEDLIKRGTLNLVDLAGSENIGRSGAKDERKKEAGMINQSLLTLGRVITSLTDHQAHVPYRESKLTRILQESLGGRAKTCIIATVSPSCQSIDETMSTLDYAARAKNIKNKPEVNQTMQKKAVLTELNRQLADMAEELQAQRDKHGVFMSADRYRGLQLQIEGQAESIRELEADIAAKVEEIRLVTQLCETKTVELAESTEAHGRTKAQLHGVERDLDGTKSKLQITRLDLAEKKLIVDEYRSTAPVIEKQGEALLHLGQQLAADVQGLHAKLERKDSLHAKNEDLVQDKLQEFNGQFKQLQQQLQAYRTDFTHTSDSLKAQLAAFVVAKNEDMHSCGQVVDDLSKCISSAATAVDKKIKAHTKSSDKTITAMTKAVNKHSESAASAASEAASAITFAGESIHATLQTQQSAIADMQSAVTAHVNMFQELAAAFVEQQAAIVMKLQDSVEQQMQALQQQQQLQQKQIEDMKLQHSAATAAAKARIMEALSLALDSGFAEQSSVVCSAASAMQATITSAAESSAVAAANFKTTASLSADAGCSYVKACAPIAQAFTCAAASLVQHNTDAAASILSQSTAATSSAAAAHKCVAAATTKLTEAVESAAADVSSGNEKLASDVDGRLKEAAEGAAVSAAEGGKIAAAALESTTAMSGVMEGHAAAEDTLCQNMYLDFAAALQTLSDTSVQLQAYIPQGDTPVKAPINLPAALKRFRDEKEVLACAHVSGLLAKAAASPSIALKSPRTPLGERNMNQLTGDSNNSQ